MKKLPLLFTTSLFLLSLPLMAAERTFVMSSAQQTVEWNPLKTYSAIEAQLYTAVYEGLMTYSPVNLKPVNGMADKWDISADKKTYHFHIRDNASFSDGRPLTAGVFRDSWLKLLDPATNSPFAGLLDPVKGAADYRTGKTKKPDAVGIRATDDQNLEVELIQPSAYFIQLVCHQSLVPIHPSLLNQADWSKVSEITGNGPFRFVKHTSDRIELVPNSRYWEKDAVQIDRLVILFSDDSLAVTKQFNQGDCNWVESGAEYNSISDSSAFQLTPQFSTTFLYFSVAKPAFQNPLVRKALILLLPLEEIRSKELFLVPSAQLIPAIPYYPKAAGLDKQDNNEALKLLEKAGFPKGKGLPTIAVEIPKSETWTKIADLMRKGWQDLDVKVEIKEIDSEQYFGQLDPNIFTIASISWIGDYADPMTFLDLWNSQSSLNRSQFADKDYDSLLNDSNSQQGAQRYKTLSKAEELLLQGGAVLPINHSPAFNVIDLKRIDGWFENPLNIHPFKYLQFKALKPPRNVASL